MFRILAILFLVVPILEIWVLIQAAQVVGGVNAIALMILISAAAAFLVRREGLGLLMRFQKRVNAGELPAKELLDGFLVAMAGALMLTPGFFTDAVGLLCLLPPSRAIIRTVLIARFGSRMTVTGPGFGGAPGTGFGGPVFLVVRRPATSSMSAMPTTTALKIRPNSSAERRRSPRRIPSQRRRWLGARLVLIERIECGHCGIEHTSTAAGHLDRWHILLGEHPGDRPELLGRRCLAERSGSPWSPLTLTAGSIGTCPSKGAPMSSASCWPPPSPKSEWREPSGATNSLMFSMTPTIRR